MSARTLLIDLSVLENRPFTGVENYALALARHLPEHLADWRLVAAIGRARLDAGSLPGFEVRVGRSLPRSLWRRLVLPRLARKEMASILFAPVRGVPCGRGFVSVRCLHDLDRPRRLEDLPTIVPSRATLGELERRQPAGRAPRAVIPHGVDDAFFALARNPIEPPRALVIGRVRARRRPDLVAAAAALAAARVPGFEVRWVGPGGEGREPRPGLRFLGHLGEDDLREEMRQARFLLAPSEVEGFGLPVVEAMAAGLPVLAREQPALSEVGGDLAAVYDSDLPEDLAAAMLHQLVPGVGPAADDLRAWARGFDWDLSARRHAEFFRGLIP